VKTRGDGVHAAFLTPDAALLAAIEMQQSIGQFNDANSGDPITIRIGINSGSSISVNPNDRLDYYGKTVNLAARLGSARPGSRERVKLAISPCRGILSRIWPLQKSFGATISVNARPDSRVRGQV